MALGIKYYTGTFHAQFETDKSTPIYALMNTADIDLHPRFILTDIQLIDESTYLESTANPENPFLKREQTAPIELHEASGNAKRAVLKAFTLTWNKDDMGTERVWTFLAEKNGRKHGRLKATGFVIVTEEVPDLPTVAQPDELSPPEVKPEIPPSPPIEIAPKGNGSNTTGGTITEGQGVVNPLEPTNSGCLPLGGIGNAKAGGCSPMGALAGGPRGGCRRTGCGLLALIPLLLVLLGMLKQCQQNQQPNATPQIIHDTVYVDRVEERVDTLTLFKTDTIQMVDSSKQTVFKPVVLPNVQFYTNSANLIPTSLSDIQQLAQHLIDTPGLDAIVIGHTDNVGEAQSNLKLSQRRAETVRNVLISMGVEGNRLTAIGKGDKEPKADNNTEEGRLMNRRVEVQLVQHSITENKTTLKQ
jgi:outer membrane protein OmpA-like peptidoglycan-associated protein